MELVDSATYFESRTGIEAFDAFELRDGRLHLRLVFAITSPSITISSSHPSCVLHDDVSGTCPCTYGDVASEGTIEFDLPVAIP